MEDRITWKHWLVPIFILLIFASVIFISTIENNKPEVHTWHQSEIIGQGYLTSVETARDGYFITLSIRSAVTEEYELITYHVGHNLRTAQSYPDTPEFRIKEWCFLYRKDDNNEIKYYLDYDGTFFKP